MNQYKEPLFTMDNTNINNKRLNIKTLKGTLMSLLIKELKLTNA